MKRRTFISGVAIALAAAGWAAWRFSWITRRIFVRSGLLKPPSNLLRNADFAQCTNPDMPDYWGSEDAAVHINFADAIRVEQSGPLEGVRSVRLRGASPGKPITLQSCGTFLPKTSPYTFSAYLRSARPRAVATLAIGWGEGLSITIDQTWRRFQITYTPSHEGELRIGLQTRVSLVESDDVWFAAPQLEEGAAPTDFNTALMDDHPLPVFPGPDKNERWSCSTSAGNEADSEKAVFNTVFGIACSTPADAQLADMRAHGFTCVALPVSVDYGESMGNQDNAGILKQFDMAQKHGIKVLPMLSHEGASRAADIPQATARTISALKDHPAIFAWCILDEPTISLHRIGYLPNEHSVQTYRAAKAADPDRPVFINENVWHADAWLTSYMLATDIASQDVYPIGRYQNPVTAVADRISKVAQEARRAHKPAAFWLQLFGTRTAPREPTPAECLAMTYLVFIHGISSIFYWSYKPASAHLWSAVASVCGEVKQIADYLSQQGSICGPHGTQDIFVHYAFWTAGKNGFVIACNAHDRHERISFDLETLPGGPFTQRTVWHHGAEFDEINGSVLTVQMRPYDRYVAVLS